MKFIECSDQYPPDGVLIYGIVAYNEDKACICQWDTPGNNWGAHTSIMRWRHLTKAEVQKIKLGKLRPYTTLKVKKPRKTVEPS